MGNRNERVKKAVEESGYLKSYIAKQIGTSATQLSLHINGKRDLPIDTEQRLKDFLKARVS